MKSDIFANTEAAAPGYFTLQNSKMLKVRVGLDGNPAAVCARQGSMVAYQGQAQFDYQGAGGLGKMIKAKLTGEGVNMMTAEGSGELFLADMASEIQVMYLENDMISVNGANVLAFSGSIEWDINRIQGRGGMMAGGLYNVALRGTGYVAVTTDGEPVVLGGGPFRHGQHLAFDAKNNYPLPNLFVSVLQGMGMEVDRFATGKTTMQGLELA